MPISGSRTVGPVTLPAVMGGGPNRSNVATGTSTRAKRTLSVSPDHQPASRRARIDMGEDPSRSRGRERIPVESAGRRTLVGGGEQGVHLELVVAGGEQRDQLPGVVAIDDL